jgi:hypothetical protein
MDGLVMSAGMLCALSQSIIFIINCIVGLKDILSMLHFSGVASQLVAPILLGNTSIFCDLTSN